MNINPRTFRQVCAMVACNQLNRYITGISDKDMETVYKHLLKNPKNTAGVINQHVYLSDETGNQTPAFTFEESQRRISCDLILLSTNAVEVRGMASSNPWNQDVSGSGCTSCGGSRNNNKNNNNNNNNNG
ncbi:MAG: hypothetical protein IJC48_09055 [Clostridia bacterium]|nr:hypothetical protein [Clostridia bacterium]